MTTATAPKRITLDEFLALPDDGTERWVCRGELRERRDPDMTRRNRLHSTTEARIAALLSIWLDGRPAPQGAVVSGEAGFILRRDPLVSAGVDVAVVTAAQVDEPDEDTAFFVGPPLLIAEVTSPYDTQRDIRDRVAEYLACGVPLVWVFNPDFRAVSVHRPGVSPQALDDRATLTGDPELPGFARPVADFFR